VQDDGTNAHQSPACPASLYHFGRLVEAFAAVEVEPEARTAYVEAGALLAVMFAYLGRRTQSRLFVERIEAIGGLAGDDDANRRRLGPLRAASTTRGCSAAIRGTPSRSRARAATRSSKPLDPQLRVPQQLHRHRAGRARDPTPARPRCAACSSWPRSSTRPSPCRAPACASAFILCFHGPTSACDEAIQLADHTVKTRGINSIYLGMAHDVLGHATSATAGIDAARARIAPRPRGPDLDPHPAAQRVRHPDPHPARDRPHRRGQGARRRRDHRGRADRRHRLRRGPAPGRRREARQAAGDVDAARASCAWRSTTSPPAPAGITDPAWRPATWAACPTTCAPASWPTRSPPGLSIVRA